MECFTFAFYTNLSRPRTGFLLRAHLSLTRHISRRHIAAGGCHTVRCSPGGPQPPAACRQMKRKAAGLSGCSERWLWRKLSEGVCWRGAFAESTG